LLTPLPKFETETRSLHCRNSVSKSKLINGLQGSDGKKGDMAMRLNKRFYLIEEDVRYYTEKFNARTPDTSFLNDPEFIAEFIRYVDFIEKEFSYQIQVANFPQIFLTKFIRV
jgi:hypothetical protein